MTFQSLQTLLDSRLLARWLPARRQLRNVAYLVAAHSLKLGLGVATSALIFRTLGPGDTGRLTLALSAVALFSVVGEFGLRDAAVTTIARFSLTAPEQAQWVARTFLASKVILSMLAGTVAFFTAGIVAARFYPQARVADLIRLGAFSLLADGLLGFSMAILEARQNFAALSALGAVQAFVRAGLIAGLLLARGLDLKALLILESVVPLAAFLYSLRFVPRSFLSLRRPVLAYLGTLFHFTKWIAVAALASTVFLRLDVLILSHYRAPVEVGLYAAALALVGKLDVVKNAVLTTAFPEACRRTERGELRAFVFQSLRLTGAASMLAVPFFVAGGALIVWLYGADFRAAIPALYPLLAAFLIGLNAEPVAYVLYPLNRPQWIAASDVLQLAVSFAASLALIPTVGIAGAAWAVLLTRVVAALITFGLVRRFLWEQVE